VKRVLLAALLAVPFAVPPAAVADSPVKATDLMGSIDLAPDGPKLFALEGIASHLGRYTAVGELRFAPGEQPGFVHGEGVAVFRAADGDLLVGVVTLNAGASVDGVSTGSMQFSWRDAIEFGDGTVVGNTGRFVDHRPAGLVDPKISLVAVLLRILIDIVLG
jgi:hypothetical protein